MARPGFSWLCLAVGLSMCLGLPPTIAEAQTQCVGCDEDDDFDSTGGGQIDVDIRDIFPGTVNPPIALQLINGGERSSLGSCTLSSVTCTEACAGNYAVGGQFGPEVGACYVTRQADGPGGSILYGKFRLDNRNYDGNNSTYDITYQSLGSCSSICPSAPTAGFTFTTYDQIGFFTDTSTGSPAGWSWDFGGEGSSTAPSPTFFFPTPGSKSVSLTASNTGGSSTDTQTVVLTQDPNSQSINTTGGTFDLDGDSLADITTFVSGCPGERDLRVVNGATHGVPAVNSAYPDVNFAQDVPDPGAIDSTGDFCPEFGLDGYTDTRILRGSSGDIVKFWLPENDNTGVTRIVSEVLAVFEADLVISSTDSADPAVAGTPLVYTITVQNLGPSDAESVVVTSTLPSGVSSPVTSGCAEDPAGSSTCTLGTISAAGSAQFTVTVVVDADTTGTISYPSAATSSTTLINTGDDSTSESTTVVAEADLSLTKAVNTPTPLLGDQVTFLLTLTNTGPSQATNVAVTDVLAAGLDYDSDVASQGSYDDASGVWSVGSLADSGSATLSITATIVDDLGRPTGTGTFLSTLVSAGSGGLDAPDHVVYTVGGELLVASSNTNQILRYSSSGTFVDAFVAAGSGGLAAPAGLEFGPDGNLYVVSAGSNNVLRYDGVSGAFIDTFVAAGSGGLSGALDLTFGPNGNLYVTSFTTGQVLRYDGTTGAFVDVFVASVNEPDRLTFGPDGDLYVTANPAGLAVERFAGSGGASLGTFVSAGSGGLDTPQGMAFGPAGHLYLVSSGTDSVLRYDTSGTFVDSFVISGDGGLDDPTDVVFGPTGHLEVASAATLEILRYDGFVANSARISASDAPDDDLTNDTASISIDVQRADYGDAPDPLLSTAGEYPTLLASDGARHLVPNTGATVFLGASVDSESDGQPSATSDGDDSDGSDDEDGVSIPGGELALSVTQFITVTGTAGAILNAWIDFDQNGSFDESGEQVITDFTTNGTTQVVSISVPPSATIGATYGRFRLHSSGGLTPRGLATDGEVEDYPVNIVVGSADLGVTKSDGLTSAIPGQQLQYTIVASNAGPNWAPVSVSDTFPLALGCSWTSVASGGATGNSSGAGPALLESLVMPASSSVTYTVTCAIDAAATGALSNTATVSSPIPDLSPGNNSATDADTVLTPQSDLSITKTDGLTTAVPGQQLTYTIVATNNGPSDDPSVSVADTFPSALTCSWTSVAAGGATGNSSSAGPILADTLSMPSGSSVSYTATCAIDPAASGTLTNTATVTASTSDPTPGNNSATDSDTVVSPEADVSVSKTDGVTTAIPGQQLTYTITAANAGPSDDPSVAITDAFPAVLTCSWTSVASGGASGNSNASGATLADTLALPAGSSVTYTASCDIDPGATGTLTNTATVSASVNDPTVSNDSATDADTTLAPEADTSITKTDGLTTAVPGQQLTYTIVAANAGPSVDPAVSVVDVFPSSLTCSWTSIAADGATGNSSSTGASLADTLSMPVGSSVTYTVTCDIDPATTGTLSNTATATASVTDPLPGNDSATDNDTTLTPEADISVTKTDGVTAAFPGQQLTYTISAANAGPSDDPSVGVTDTFAAVLTCSWTSVATGGASGNSASAGAALGDTLSMPAGSSVNYTVTCDIDPAATGTLSNTATVAASVTDPVVSNNSATDDDTSLEPLMTSMVVDPVTVSFSDIAQPITLSAATTSSIVVNQGTVTFQVVSGTTPIGSAVTSATLTNGNAVVTYQLPASLPSGSYSIEANYSGGTNFDPATATGSLLIDPLLPGDDDGDGVDNDTENGAVNLGDCNDDGTGDAYQTNVTSLPSTEGSYLCLVSTDSNPAPTYSGQPTTDHRDSTWPLGGTGSCRNENVTAIDIATLPDDAVPAATLNQVRSPLSFELDCTAATVTIFYEGVTNLTDAAYRAYGPTPSDPSLHWYTLSATFGTRVIGGEILATATLDLADGETGDHDLTTDGRIVALGGPALAIAAIPTLSIWAMLLLALLLGAAAVLQSRSRA